MEYKVEKLDAKTWVIEEGNGPASVYMYLLEGEKEAALIDTGMGSIPLKEICSGLTKKKLHVFLTHAHVDHIGGAYAFEDVYMHPADRELYLLHSLEKVRRLFGVNPSLPVKEDLHELREGMVCELGNRRLRILHTPGHSVGSVCILDENSRYLFTGDTCCKAHVLLQMEYAAPVETYLQSIRRLLKEEAAYDLTWPGHHEKPVSKEILVAFKEAAEGLLNGSLTGKEAKLPSGNCCLLTYKEIGIEYRKA